VSGLGRCGKLYSLAWLKTVLYTFSLYETIDVTQNCPEVSVDVWLYA